MQPLSISIVAFHDYDDIKKAITSIVQYTSIPYEMYVFDNSVDDPQKEEFQSFLQVNHVHYVDNHENQGFGKGHNHALEYIDSKYHAIINPDIVIQEDVFGSIFQYLDHHPEVGMVIPKIVDDTGHLQEAYRKEITVFDMFTRYFGRHIFKKRIQDHTLSYMDYSKPFQVPFAQGCFLVIRTNLFRQLHGFDDRFFMYMEDADLSKRINQVSKVMYLPDVEVIHHWQKGSHKNKRLFKIHVQSARKYFHKWGWKLW